MEQELCDTNHGTGLAVVLLYICQIIWKMFILSRLIAADMCLLLPFCGGGNGQSYTSQVL